MAMPDPRVGEVVDSLLGLSRALGRHPLAYVPRQLAGQLVAIQLGASGCARCGGELPTPGMGRPRRYCLSCSPRKVPEKSGIRQALNDIRKEPA
jgi:hypothetical protein